MSFSSCLYTVTTWAVTSRGGLKPTSSANSSRSFHHRAPPRHSPVHMKDILSSGLCEYGTCVCRLLMTHTPEHLVVFNFLRQSSIAVDVAEVQLTSVLTDKHDYQVYTQELVQFCHIMQLYSTACPNWWFFSNAGRFFRSTERLETKLLPPVCSSFTFSPIFLSSNFLSSSDHISCPTSLSLAE